MAVRIIKGKAVLDDKMSDKAHECATSLTKLGVSASDAGIKIIALNARMEAAQGALSGFAGGIGQLNAGLRDTIGLTEEQDLMMRSIVGSFNMTVGPITAFIGLIRVANVHSIELGISLGALSVAILGVGLLFAVAKSEAGTYGEMMFWMTGITWGLAGALFAVSLALKSSIEAFKGPAGIANIAMFAGAVAAAMAVIGYGVAKWSEGRLYNPPPESAPTTISNTQNVNIYTAGSSTIPYSYGQGRYV